MPAAEKAPKQRATSSEKKSAPAKRKAITDEKRKSQKKRKRTPSPTPSNSSEEPETEATDHELSETEKQERAKRADATKWTPEEIDSLVAQLLQAKVDGAGGEGGFRGAVWTPIAKSFADPLKNVVSVCESKWTRLKIDFKEVRKLRVELTGFGWDEKNQWVTAQPEIWLDLKKVGFYSLLCI